MLKSIVNGAEHDIVSIPMKGKNLFDINGTVSFIYTDMSISNNSINISSIGNGATSRVYFEKEYLAGTYTITAKFNGDITSVRLFSPVQFQGATYNAYYGGYFAEIGDSLTVTFTEPFTAGIIARGTAKGNGSIYDIMLNTGSTTLPYEPYGYQNGWEVRDNQNRIIWGREDELQTTTGTLMFNGYDLPIKVKSLLGDSAQNGTPSPDSPIVPEFCGVRTKNICPSATAETKTNNGITAVSNGSGTYHVSGTATADADIRFNVQSFWIPQSIGNYHDGTFSMFNSAIYDNMAVKLAFYYQGTKLDDWGLTSLNRTNTTYSIMSEKDCDAIGFTVKSGVTVDFTISPEFTNDGVLPTEFEPYGYKIPFTCAGQTTPVYLGEVPTVRRVKKYIFTGKENITNVGDYYNTNVSVSSIAWSTTASTTRGFQINNSGNRIWALKTCFSDYATPEAFKTYLQQQYAAGTPVTVWYVLATPTTGIVNEPLCKIGTYADELHSEDAGVTIPTVKGANVLTVETELQPSEMTITFKG